MPTVVSKKRRQAPPLFPSYTDGMTTKSPLREEFEHERKRSAFLSALAAGMTGIIAVDTWVVPWGGVFGGVAVGGAAWLFVYGYESFAWRRKHE